MHVSVSLILMVFAFVLFALSAAGVDDAPRFRLLPAGLACWALAVLLGGVSLS